MSDIRTRNYKHFVFWVTYYAPWKQWNTHVLCPRHSSSGCFIEMLRCFLSVIYNLTYSHMHWKTLKTHTGSLVVNKNQIPLQPSVLPERSPAEEQQQDRGKSQKVTPVTWGWGEHLTRLFRTHQNLATDCYCLDSNKYHWRFNLSSSFNPKLVHQIKSNQWITFPCVAHQCKTKYQPKKEEIARTSGRMAI